MTGKLTWACTCAQVSTSDNQDINVGTKINAFVYNTLAQWYNEDMAAAKSNNTLPAAPSGPQPPPTNANPKTFLGVRLEWNNPVFIAVSACPLHCLMSVHQHRQ